MMRGARPRGVKRALGLALLVALASTALMVLATSAWASASWRLVAHPAPTQLPREGTAFLSVQAINRSDSEISASATPVVITDKLPAGVIATKIEGTEQNAVGVVQEASWKCTGVGTGTVQCTYDTGGVAGAK